MCVCRVATVTPCFRRSPDRDRDLGDYHSPTTVAIAAAISRESSDEESSPNGVVSRPFRRFCTRIVAVSVEELQVLAGCLITVDGMEDNNANNTPL